MLDLSFESRIRVLIELQRPGSAELARVEFASPLTRGFFGEARQITLGHTDGFEPARQTSDSNEVLEPARESFPGVLFDRAALE